VRAIVVGAQSATRDLLKRLSERWTVTVVDPDASLLERVKAVREVEMVVGDGSSRVTLARARLSEADAVIAASADDEVNLEVCRLAQEAGMVRIAAVAADSEHLDRYRELGVPAFAPDSLIARQLESSLEPRRISSTPFAAGRAEALEFRIADDSPVRGLSLSELSSDTWLVAAVLRGEALIVPHGSTVLQAGDQVTVVGATADFSRIVRTFTAGEARFPLDFGKSVLLALGSRADAAQALNEALEITRNSAADSLIVAHRDQRGVREEGESAEIDMMLGAVASAADGVDVRFSPVAGDPTRRISDVVATESVGVIVVPTLPGSRLGRFRASRLLRRAIGWRRPVLFARGSGPYRRIVAPARDTPSALAAARAAIDLAGDGGGEVIGVAVVPPVFLTGTDGREHALRALAAMREEASVLAVPVRRVVRQGNPVRVIASLAENGQLVVLGTAHHTPTIVTPGIVGHVLQRVESSVLVVPAAP
jgi:trk system potassium uptake protein TrkA